MQISKNIVKHSAFSNAWFYVFIFTHLFVWTLLPTLLRYTLPLDAVEGTTWGQHFCLGYDKNPFLNAWLTELAVQLGGKSAWMVYGLGQLCVVTTFWAVWKLGKQLLHPAYALIAVMLLEGITSYNIDSIDFNDNVLQLALWALIILSFYLAVHYKRTVYWILVGLFSGLALMAKYFVAILFIFILLFPIISPQARKSLSCRKLLLAFLVFLLVILPHTIWLTFHHFITAKYALFRTYTSITWINHFKFVWLFGTSYLFAFILPFLLFATLWLGKKSKKEIIAEKKALSASDRQFLLWFGIGPFCLVLLLSLTTGMALHSGWGQPLTSLWGLILVAYIQPSLTKKNFYRFLAIFLGLFAIGIAGYTFVTLYHETDSANYPGPVIAKRITQIWHEQYHSPLHYIIGPRFTAGVASFYSLDRPSVYIDADAQASPWINERNLKEKGAMIIWDADNGSPLPPEWKQRFLPLLNAHVETFPWMRGKKLAPPVKVGIALLPPQSGDIK